MEVEGEEKEGGREGEARVRGVVVIGGRLERRQDAIEEIHSLSPLSLELYILRFS